MKKLIAILVVLLFAAPALAADWSFYGSARMHTFYYKRDFGDLAPNAGVNGAGLFGDQQGTRPGNVDDDQGLVWDWASNSRLGARVKADKVSGIVELGLPSENTHDGTAVLRRLAGTWTFADNMKLKVGKDYTPTSQLISNQAFYEDIAMLGLGTNYGRRPPFVGIQIGGFELDFIQPNGTVRNAYGGDVDEYLPKIEAGFSMNFGMFAFKVFGGFLWFQVEDNGGTLTDTIDVYAYILGGDVTAKFGPVSITALGSWGQNWSNGRWNDVGFTSNANAGAIQKGTDDTDDCKSWLVGGIVNFKLTDTLNFEVGGGFRSDDQDAAAKKDTVWQVYGNATITLAPGVYLVPEVGYYDWMKNAADVDEGYQWYAGAKWQIDF